jgi:ABC-type phosphate transport system permease subunit
VYPDNLKELRMPEQSPVRYYNWTRTCFIFVAVLMVITLIRFLAVGPRNYWPLIPLLPLPFLFLLNLWLAFRRTHKALNESRHFYDPASHSAVEALFGLSLTAACGLLIALIVGFLIAKSLTP